MANGGSIVIEQWSNDPKFDGLKPVAFIINIR
jgi:hypothetical protein